MYTVVGIDGTHIVASSIYRVCVVPRRRAILAWHFLHDDGKLSVYHPYGGQSSHRKTLVVKGMVSKRVAQPIELCAYGLHGSVRLLNALRYAPGTVLQRTLHWGKVQIGPDKLASSHRKCVAVERLDGKALRRLTGVSRVDLYSPKFEDANKAVEDTVLKLMGITRETA